MVAAMEILLTGSSGLIGTSLVRLLQGKRISTILLNRKKSGSGHENDDKLSWDPYAAQPMGAPEALAGITGAIHLSGVNLSGHRWSPSYKREILESRTKPTYALARLLAGLRPRPSVMVCASAVGIYGSRGDEMLTEAAGPGQGFLAETCIAWEKATQPAEDAGIRVVHARFGVVLDRDGGALKQMLPIFRFGLGGRLGDGGQWLSWIALPDVSRALAFALECETLRGPVNVVAPQPVTNAEFTRTLGGVLRRPAFLPVPPAALRLAFGEMAGATVLASQRAKPACLEQAGFRFDYPDLEAGLRVVLASGPESV